MIERIWVWRFVDVDFFLLVDGFLGEVVEVGVKISIEYWFGNGAV